MVWQKRDYRSCIFFHPSLLKCLPLPHLGHRQCDHSPGPKKSGPTISAKCGSGRHSILQHRGFIPTTARRSRSGGQMVHRKKYRAARWRIGRRSCSSPAAFWPTVDLPWPEESHVALVLRILLVLAGRSSPVAEPRTRAASAPCGGHLIPSIRKV